MDGGEIAEEFLHCGREGIVGGAHGDEEGVAAIGRHFDGAEDRAHGGDLVVGVVGVPGFADGLFLVFFFEDGGDFGVAIDGFEEAVDVDGAEAAGECEMVFGAGMLAAQDDDRIFGEGGFDGGEVIIAANVGAGDFGAEGTGEWVDVHLPSFLNVDP